MLRVCDVPDVLKNFQLINRLSHIIIIILRDISWGTDLQAQSTNLTVLWPICLAAMLPLCCEHSAGVTIEPVGYAQHLR